MLLSNTRTHDGSRSSKKFVYLSRGMKSGRITSLTHFVDVCLVDDVYFLVVPVVYVLQGDHHFYRGVGHALDKCTK